MAHDQTFASILTDAYFGRDDVARARFQEMAADEQFMALAKQELARLASIPSGRCHSSKVTYEFLKRMLP